MKRHESNKLARESLDSINVEGGPMLIVLTDEAKALGDLSASQGNNEVWTSDVLYSHLNMLKKFVTFAGSIGDILVS